MVEHNLAKVGVASSSLVFRSESKRTIEWLSSSLFNKIQLARTTLSPPPSEDGMHEYLSYGCLESLNAERLSGTGRTVISLLVLGRLLLNLFQWKCPCLLVVSFTRAFEKLKLYAYENLHSNSIAVPISRIGYRLRKESKYYL